MPMSLAKLKFSYYNFFIPYEEEDIYIIYNSLSNAMLQVSFETGKFISNLNSMEIHHLGGDLIEMLRKYKVIIDINVDEFELIADRANNTRKKFDQSDTLFMVIAPTNMCNMNCPYCYQGDKSGKASDTKYLGENNMSALLTYVENTIKKPYSEKPIKKIKVEWFGGEPLVRKKVVEDFSQKVIELANSNNIEYSASIITNGSLIDEKTWLMLEKSKISEIQITIDGNKDMHDSLRVYINGKGTYDKIMSNLKLMPKNRFRVTIRINGDRKVYNMLDGLFDDLEDRELWPQRSKEIDFHWAPKFYNYLGFNQDKDIYYTSHEYQKSREDFAKLKVSKYNNWAKRKNIKSKNLKIAYPSFAEFYCGTVESPNSVSIDDGGYVHKCYNTINDKDKRIQHISDFDIKAEGMEYYRAFDKTKEADCRTCKAIPICEENCNMRFLSREESIICSPW